MPGLKEELKQLKFVRRGTIKLDKGKLHPRFDFDYKSFIKECNGMVYIWIIDEKGEPSSVIYIGSTGKTAFDRCKQHEHGFKHSKRGKALSEQLLKILSGGKTISFYIRKSQKRTIFGELVSLYAAEETALIRKFRQSHIILNKHGKDGTYVHELLEIMASPTKINRVTHVLKVRQ